MLGAFVAAGICSIVLTILARRLAPRLGAVAVPTQDRWHRGTIPLLGGIAVWGGTLAGTLAFGTLNPHVLAVLLSGTLMGFVGLVDDFVQLKPSTKLTAQIVSACFVLLFGVALGWTASPVLNALLTLAWIVGVSNAVNLLDNMDGLCAGVVAIAALSFALSGGSGDPGVGILAIAVAGGCAGFLVFNFSPASIFLGDTGSLFLGSTIAVLATLGERGGRAGVVSTLLVPALLLLIPLFDTAFVTVSRKLSARPASVGGRDHTSHRLVALGFSERYVVMLFYGLAGVSGAVAIGLHYASFPEASLILGVMLLGLLLLGIHLARVKVYGGGQDLSALRNRVYTPLLRDITYKRRMFEVMLDFALVSFSYYAAYVIRFDTDFPLYYDLLVQSLPIVIAAQLVSFFVVGVYRPMWRYFSASDLATYVRGLLLGSVTSVLALVYLYRFEGYSRGVFIIYTLCTGVLMVGSRASFRILTDMASRHSGARNRAVIYGAGDGGALVVREVRSNVQYDYHVVSFMDDDPAKRHRRVLGIPVAGSSRDLAAILRDFTPSVVIVSSDKIPAARVDAVAEACGAAGVQVLRLDFRLREIPVRTAPRAAGASPRD